MKVLKVVHTRTFDNRPLVLVDLPGEGAEMTPGQMKDLAAALIEAARECESRPTGRDFRRVDRQYPLGNPPESEPCHE